MLFNYASEAKSQLNMVEFKNMIDKLDESKNIIIYGASVYGELAFRGLERLELQCKEGKNK